LMEALRLWVQDLDFERRELTVSDGKGGKDRRTMLPVGGGEPLQAVRRLNKMDKSVCSCKGAQPSKPKR